MENLTMCIASLCLCRAQSISQKYPFAIIVKFESGILLILDISLRHLYLTRLTFKMTLIIGGYLTLDMCLRSPSNVLYFYKYLIYENISYKGKQA